jgi:hypothetical protein
MKLDDIIKALNELAPLEVLRRDNGSYYCSLIGVEIGSCGILVSPTQAAKTPKEAILECWGNHTDLKTGECVVVNAGNPRNRKELLWIDGKWTSRKAMHKGIRVRNAKDLAGSPK